MLKKKCTASIKTNRQNHSFHVEFIVFANASIRFCQVLLLLWICALDELMEIFIFIGQINLCNYIVFI